MIISEEKREVLRTDADALLVEVESLVVKLQHEECLQKLQVLMNDYEIIGEYRQLLKCHIYRALCHYNLGNLKEAFMITNQYEDLCKQYKQEVVQHDFYPLLGLQYMYSGDMKKAVKYYDLAAESALKNGLYRLYIASKKHVAHAANQLQQFDVSLQAIESAKKYLSKINADDINQIEIYLVEIKTYLDMNKLELAEKQLNYVSSHPLLMVDEVTNSLYYEYYANYFLKRNEYLVAYNYAVKGLKLLEGKDQFVSEQDILELLIKICTPMEDKSLLIGVYEKYVENLKSSREKDFQNELTKRDLEDMKKLTIIDNLTGVYNRMFLIEQASEWLNMAPMNNESIICSVFDVDHFKGINDTFGHLTGDRILQELAAYCNNLIDKDIMFVARYGGDEFVILKRTTNIEQGLEIIQNLYHQLNQYEVQLGTNVHTLSISMGISHTQLGEYILFEELFGRADIALYRSKENGRKMFSLYQ